MVAPTLLHTLAPTLPAGSVQKLCCSLPVCWLKDWTPPRTLTAVVVPESQVRGVLSAVSPETLQATDTLSSEAGDGAEAVELIAPSADTVVLGAKVPGLAEVGGEPLEGQLFNVFRVREGRIIAVVDYALRDDALQAAGATSPAWR